MHPPHEVGSQSSDFSELLSAHRDRLFGFIFAHHPHQADAEDLLQRCSMLLWKKFDEYDRSRPFFPWACSLTHGEIRNFLRAAGRRKVQFPGELLDQIAIIGTEALAASDSRLEALERCLKILREQDREFLHSIYGENRSAREFAEASSTSAQVVYNRLSQLRRKLFDCINRRIAKEGG